MTKDIFGIGSGRYIFDKKTLDSFIEEARHRSVGEEPVLHRDHFAAGTDGDPSEEEILHVFEEIMSLYHDYMRCQSIDLLVRLKDRLEEFSIRYKSLVLAEEVLSINSCLPYEKRISSGRKSPC